MGYKIILIIIIAILFFLINLFIDKFYIGKINKLDQSGNISGLIQCYDVYIRRECRAANILAIRSILALYFEDIEKMDELLVFLKKNDNATRTFIQINKAYLCRLLGKLSVADEIVNNAKDRSEKKLWNFANTTEMSHLLYDAWKSIEDHKNIEECQKLLMEYDNKVEIGKKDILWILREYVSCLLLEQQGCLNIVHDIVKCVSLKKERYNIRLPILKYFDRWVNYVS